MTRFYLIRHGQTQYNIDFIMQGWSNSNLTDEGITQANATSKNIKDVNFKLVICSPLGRTKETYNILMKDRLDIPVVYDERVKEVCFGKYDGKPISDVPIKEYKKRLEWDWDKVGGETYDQVGLRFTSCLKEYGHKYPMDNILVVTHGGALMALTKIIDNNRYQQMTSSVNRYQNCSINIIDYDINKDNFTFVKVNSYEKEI